MLGGTLSGGRGMGYPIPGYPSLGYPPGVDKQTNKQTETITFQHPSDAGGNN